MKSPKPSITTEDASTAKIADTLDQHRDTLALIRKAHNIPFNKPLPDGETSSWRHRLPLGPVAVVVLSSLFAGIAGIAVMTVSAIKGIPAESAPWNLTVNSLTLIMAASLIRYNQCSAAVQKALNAGDDDVAAALMARMPFDYTGGCVNLLDAVQKGGRVSAAVLASRMHGRHLRLDHGVQEAARRRDGALMSHLVKHGGCVTGMNDWMIFLNAADPDVIALALKRMPDEAATAFSQASRWVHPGLFVDLGENECRKLRSGVLELFLALGLVVDVRDLMGPVMAGDLNDLGRFDVNLVALQDAMAAAGLDTDSIPDLARRKLKDSLVSQGGAVRGRHL